MNQGSFVTIPLRDGAQASVGYDGVRVRERVYALATIQDARQVAPDPETVALRVANERHGVEFQPARPGDGALLLEAIFRLRPDLRPAGFETPGTLPPGFPPLAPAARQPAMPNPWGVQSGWPPPPAPGMPVPPPGYAPPSGYAPSVGATGGRLTPYPRSASALIAAIFELFVAHWRRWLLLGVVALFVPEIVRGGVDALFHVVSGNNLWAGLPFATRGAANGSFGVGGAGLPGGNDLALSALDLLISAVIGAIIGGWSAAVLGIASRDALFGRMPSVGAALRAGLRRLFPAIGASILSGVLTLVILLPVFLLYGIILSQFGNALADPTTLDPSSSAAGAFAVLGCLALLLLLPCGIGAIYVGIRLALSAYIAATEPLGPVASVRKSWNLTRGHWWHTFLPLFVLALLTGIISIPPSFAQYASFGVATLLVIPLVAALTAPLVAIAAVAVLYDLRLRREGYEPLASEGGAASADDEPAPTSA